MRGLGRSWIREDGYLQMSTLGMVTFDCHDAPSLARWWAERLNGEATDFFGGSFCIVSAPGIPIRLGFQHVADVTPGKNRIHLDLDLAPGETRTSVTAKWTSSGATHLDTQGEASFRWDVLADPEGNVFCIGDPH